MSSQHLSLLSDLEAHRQQLSTALKSSESNLDEAEQKELRRFLRLSNKLAREYVELKQSYDDMDVILGTTVEHNTEIENELSIEKDHFEGESKQFEFIVNAAAEHMGLLNESLRFEAVNRAFSEFFGLTPKKAQRTSVEDLFGPKRYNLQLRDPLARAFKGFRQHVQCTYKRGKRTWIFDISLMPYRRRRSKVKHVGIIIRDVTEKMHAERQIKKQAALLDNAQDAILVLDKQLKVRYCNHFAKRVYGSHGRQIIGQPITAFTPIADRKHLTTAQHAVEDTGEWVGELAQLNSHRKKFFVESHWTRVEQEGSQDEILVINSDISEKKELQMHLIRAQRMESIGTLASGISHDLNNILAPFFMAFRSLEPKLKDDNQAMRILKVLESSATRGADLVKQILSFARGIEGNQHQLQLKYVINEIEGLMRETFPKNIRAQVSVEKDLWSVTGDAVQLHQVLLNLCVNARDSLENRPGTIRVQAENEELNMERASAVGLKPGAYVKLSVKDNGCGMTDEVKENIFEPFFTTKTESEGTGIGLSTVRSVVELHSGVIHVDSALQKGTTFSLYLPATLEPTMVQLPTGVTEIPHGSGETILVVDDETAIRAVTRVALEANGYKVRTARDGREALRILGTSDIQLVVLDMMMPRMDGIETLSEIRKTMPDLKVIGVSGELVSDDGEAKQYPIEDMQDFLQKPYTSETLLSTIGSSIK